MSHTQERIEIVELIHLLKRPNESPGFVILRALRRMARKALKKAKPYE